MPGANLVVVQTFANRLGADLAKSALDAADIDSMIQGDSVGGMRPHVAWASGGFKLLVRQGDVAEAREILHTPQDQE
jgi:hypothetical protein